MATDFRVPEISTIQNLRWEIQQELYQLTSAANIDLLFKLAMSCKDETEEAWPDENATYVEL